MDHHACTECREYISAFVDGELSPDDRVRMMSHLANCVDCRETLEVYRLIGTRMRSMPAAQPPDHLIDTIFANTIDAQPRRLFIVSSRLGYSLAAVAAVLLIFVVAVYLIVGGYQRGIRPQVADSEPGNGDTWPIQRPIEITFNKDMDHDSVDAALAIIPEEESERLSRTWDGNTLLIGMNQNLIPGTTYQILISGTAVDTFGNKLESDFRLSFGTTSTVQTPMTPTPRPTMTDSQQASVTAEPATPTVRQPTTNDGTQVAQPTAMLQGQPSATSDSSGGIGGVGTPGTVAPTATSTPQMNLPTPTREPGETPVVVPTEDPVDPASPTPSATPTPSTTPTPTEEPSPTPSPSPTATTPPQATATSPKPTPTEATIPVTGGFGDVYWADETLQLRLGQPLAPAVSTGALQLGFQGGTMYYRGDTATIYVLNSNSLSWSSFLDTSTSSPEPELVPDTDPELWIPGGVLGYLWSAEQSVRDEMGFAIHEYPASFSAQVQKFEGGVMLSSPDTIWVIYNDQTFDWFGNSGG